ncbi:hypothetical protein CFE70_005752 [Pyrenophora teres f. teres 0-1]
MSAYTSALGLGRNFSATARQSKDHHFDTLKFVQRLQEEGFTEEQAEGMMRVLSDVIEESIQNLTRTMVLREDQEKATYTQKVDFAKLRSELMTADSTESSLTRASHERLTNELAKLNSRLRDEIQRTQASVRLDLNLEKGRIREEANVQELKLKETDTRIEQETAQLRERLEAVKFSTLQWLMGLYEAGDEMGEKGVEVQVTQALLDVKACSVVLYIVRGGGANHGTECGSTQQLPSKFSSCFQGALIGSHPDMGRQSRSQPLAMGRASDRDWCDRLKSRSAASPLPVEYNTDMW